MITLPSPMDAPSSEQPWVARVAQLAAGFAETAADDDRDARLPVEHLRALHECGLDAAFLPVEHGGEGLSYATLGAVVHELASKHPAVATVWLMHIGAAHALVTLSVPETAAFFAAELRQGKRFSNALSEPAGGNHFLSSQQDADETADGWSLTGRKLFVSGSEIADHLFLNVRVQGEIAFFGASVDETMSFPPIDETMGMRATRSRTIVFDRTPLPAMRRSGIPAPDYANLISVGFAFLSTGIAFSALDAMSDSARRPRGPAGSSALAEAEWVHSETGAVATEARAAMLLAQRVAWLADTRSTEANHAAGEAKMFANVTALKAAALALRVGGGGAYLMKSPIQRVFRDAQAGALMAYSVPFTQRLVGGAVFSAGA